MIQAQRSRANQKLYQASLLLDAAAQPQDELNQVAWQQACHEAALNALEAAEIAFLRELAVAYRLNLQAVKEAGDLEKLAAERQQQLPELKRLQAEFRNPASPLSRLQPALLALRQPPAVSDGPEVDEGARISLASAEEPQTLEERQLADARAMHQAMKSLFQELREQLLEH
ncbi:DUF6586 family protein [Marinospirillum sp.]|uniref:DUF6586 family protein n=1 Tax=Marinospirillum sp. TaxID=2183934 RepID=UPI00384D6F88